MSTTASLEDRVAALEQAIKSQPDRLTPNYLTVNPDGTVGADFTGLINALGLTLPAFTGPPASQGSSSIEWIRQSDGAAVASMFGSDVSGIAEVQVFADAPETQAQAAFGAQPANTSGAGAQLLANWRQGDNLNTDLSVDAAGKIAKILDANGASDFVQMTEATASFLSWGVATSGTGAVSTPGSGDWTCSGPTTGELTINFPARTNTPCIVATGYSGSQNPLVQVLSVSAAACTLLTFTPGLALINVLVGFVILGGI